MYNAATTPPATLVKTSLLIGLTALLGTVATSRFHHAGEWLPPLPDTVGTWQRTETPLDASTLSALGNPKATACIYTNGLGNQVMASIVSAGPFENYHDPTVCVTGSGYRLSGIKRFGLSGTDARVRAMVFKLDRGYLPQGSPDTRIVMYYWQQNYNGTTDTEARMGNYRDIEARFKTGWGAVVMGNQTCIVRIYTVIVPDDAHGVQAQRNVDEISRAVWETMKQNSGAAK